jgi:hypothetical protein
MNLALCEGLLKGLGRDGTVAAVLDPRPGECCVAFRSPPEQGPVSKNKTQ